MPKSVEFQQIVARSINYDRFEIPRIRDGDRWRIIQNAYLVENPFHANGRDRYEDAILRTQKIMKQLGWHTRITETRQDCHEHLYYQQLTLRCWK